MQSPEATVPDIMQPVDMQRLVTQVGEVVQCLSLKEIVGLGVGAGGYILAQFAAENPKAGWRPLPPCTVLCMNIHVDVLPMCACVCVWWWG
jgi:hypothetical protein